MDTAAILNSQYQASLEMLRQAIVQCPESVWNAAGDKNKFWHVAYHALFFTHLYVHESEKAFIPPAMHRDELEDFDLTKIVAPYDKAAVLEYLAFCQQHVAERLPQLDLEAREGFGNRTFTVLELQIYSIRHIMQHAGELMERLASRTDAQIDWVGGRKRV